MDFAELSPLIGGGLTGLGVLVFAAIRYMFTDTNYKDFISALKDDNADLRKRLDELAHKLDQAEKRERQLLEQIRVLHRMVNRIKGADGESDE